MQTQQTGGEDKNDNNEAEAHSARTKSAFTRPIPKKITKMNEGPASRRQALRYQDRSAWAKSINLELDKIDKSGTIRWLKPGKLGILPKRQKLFR